MNLFTVQIVNIWKWGISFINSWIDSTEVAARSGFVKKMIFQKLQNSKKRSVHKVFVLSKRQSVFFNLITKKLRHRCFHMNFVKFFRTLYFVEHLQTTAYGRSLLTCVCCVGLWFKWVAWVRRSCGSNRCVGYGGRVCLQIFLRKWICLNKHGSKTCRGLTQF